MKHNKDVQVLGNIILYCDEVTMVLEACDGSIERFEESPLLRNACAMPLSQIGELATHLSDDAIAGIPEIPWRNVQGLRDFFPHGCHHLNVQVMWESAEEDIPMLRKACDQYIGDRHLSI